MILKVDTLIIFFVLSVNADINLTTVTGTRKSINRHGIDIHNSTSIYFNVKTCYTAIIGLQDKNTKPGYSVIFNKAELTITKIHSYDISYDCTPWSGMDCNCYVSLWISWIDGRIAVGKGTRIGTDVCNQLDYSWTTDINVTDIYISSNTTAYWLFAFPENTTSACSTNGTDGTVGIGPETINTTETTLPGFVLTTISKKETTTPGFDPTSINTTETTLPGFVSTTTRKIETTTPGFYLTSINTTVTTTPGFLPTTISTTETTFPGYNPTTISATETTTPGFAPISVGMVNTTPVTTKNIKTTSTKKSCICPCSNFTMTEDELIKKIAQLKSELSVDPKLTSKYKRSLVSASDDRPSSKYIGTFGIVVIVVICSLIVLMDFQHYSHVIFQKKN